ncbi:MAG: hypothetical protein IKN70_05010 [Fibrobacter sp.]|nr:hypothetical protein [Fibrobacter sp.]
MAKKTSKKKTSISAKKKKKNTGSTKTNTTKKSSSTSKKSKDKANDDSIPVENDPIPEAINNEVKEVIESVRSITEGNTSFADAIYNGISNAIGGTNPNQFITLMLPGIILNAKDYAYDYDSNAPKSVIVEQNESRLANKMFDPCRMTGSDNGFSLPYQYKAALDMLTPKINKTLAEQKTKLRQLLISDYPYDFGDGSETVYSLQEVYFRLYDEYMAEVSHWNKVQQEKKTELQKKFPINSEYNEAYLEWYEHNAELYLNEIEEKKSKILSVFSPNDMKTLEGILDSGCGAELQEARQALLNERKLTPGGGSVYPVRFSPPDWFKLIGSSFTPADLLRSPEEISEELQIFSVRRMELYSFVLNTAALIKNADIVTLYNSAKKFKDVLDDEKSPFVKSYGTAINKVIYSAIDIKTALAARSKMQQSVLKRLSLKAEPLLNKNLKSAGDVVSTISSNLGKYADIQQQYINQMSQLISALESLLLEKSTVSHAHFNDLLAPVFKQLRYIDEKIAKLQQQMEISSEFYEEGKTDRLNATDSTVIVPEGFTQVHISSNFSELTKSMTNVYKTTSKGIEFLFLGTKNQTSATPVLETLLDQSCDVEIDMNVSKVGIERDWFNPGVFALTRDMLKLGDTLISPADDYTDMSDERLGEMQKCLFPSYPIAMIIARDIKLSFKFKQTANIEEFYQYFEKHAKYGGDFLIFKGTSITSGNPSGVHSCLVNDDTIVLKIDTTQLIGYYQEATRADKSAKFEATSISSHEKKSFQSISDFVSNYKNVLSSSERLVRLHSYHARHNGDVANYGKKDRPSDSSTGS